MAACEFDRLFAISVPDILERIFFYLDYESYKECLEVSKGWKQMLSTESLKRRAKLVYEQEISLDEIRLYRESQRGDVDAVKNLISSGLLDLNKNHRHGTPLHTAYSHGHLKVVKLLLDAGADPAVALLHASMGGHSDVVKTLLDSGGELIMSNPTNPHYINYRGVTLLHIAAMSGHKDYVQRAMDKGTDPNVADQYGNTPLYYAVLKGHKDTAKILQAHGGTV